MTIDRTKLVKLLIEKTSLSPGEVEKQLEQLIERILDAADRGKALEIKEFGLFFFDQEGDLKFEPSEELSTEISFKYAGMKPVELKPERNTAIPADEDPSGPINAADDLIVVPKSEQKSSSEQPKAAPKPKSAVNPKSASKSISKKTTRGKKDRSAIWALLAFFTVLAIGALIYFNRPLDTVSGPSVSVTETSPLGSGITDSLDISTDIETELASNEGATEVSGNELNNDAPVKEQISAATVSVQNQVYGLTGELMDEANNVYSIVIHSFYNELRADQVAENFRADGYRVQVTARFIGGLDVWRVSLGQFESIPDAQAAAETLPEPFNENNFIQRIRQQ